MAGRQKTAGKTHAATDIAAKAEQKKSVQKKSKTIKIKHHHAKPYRKRHISALVLFIIASSVLITLLIIYRERVINSVDSAQNYLSDVFNPAITTEQNVSSTYGYSLQYDVRSFNASAIDASSGDLYINQELATNRAYQVMRISTSSTSVSKNDINKNTQRSLTLNYYDNQAVTSITDVALINQEKTSANFGVDTSKATVSLVSTSTTTVGGQQFRVSEWKIQQLAPSIASKVPVEFRTYAGVINGKALIMKLTYGLSTGKNREVFKPIIDSLKFGDRKQSAIKASKQVAAKIATNQSLLDSLTLTHLASAATATPPADISEQISSRYSPAVIKIYNVYCMDITIDGKAYAENICDGSTGSGFFVDGGGDIATNGHVASADPLDIVILHAVTALVAGDQSEFNYIANLAGVTESNFTGNESIAEIVDYVVNKAYSISSTRITATNNVNNLLVGLNEKQPDITELLKDTENRKQFAEQSSVKRATLVAKDYRVVDGITVNGNPTFKASDVALIKIDGSDFPVTKLGSISGVSQGAGLLILGYPGEASDNGLVDSTVSKPTLTAGKVSSIKTVSGNSKKLIETDATIGHGNSGGPVFDDSGNVIGIATYTIDGAGQGDGTYNYIRDIQDLKDLASKNSVTVNGTSQTQTEWNKGIDLFYKAHYSKAVKSFNKVKTLYPQHPKADELIAAANERIKNGQDVKDFPYVLAIIAAVSVIGIGVMVFLIVRHRKAHKVYVGQVATGMMQPMAPGAQPQMVSYDPNAYRGQMPMYQPQPGQVAQQPMPAQPVMPPAGTMPAPQVYGPAQSPTVPGGQPPRIIQ
jgi:S1-C subfamily serine protease